MAKHIMLSYQWDNQEVVERVYDQLSEFGLPVWMDIKGGMKGNINDAMAYGVENAACICPFLSAKYQESKNCKKELNYADDSDVDIVPAMTQKDWKASSWLGVITAKLLWIDFRPGASFEKSVESLAKEIMHVAGDKVKIADSQPPDVPESIEKKPGRAFKHQLTGKFLAESGQVKFHPASGNRSTLVLRDTPEDTSYWEEERQDPKSEILYYKNYATNGYLGYDPNGDYIYTKGQHYGAEEWLLKADEQSRSGERAVVLFANFGKKYLAIRNGELTGVSNRADDCIWILD